MKKVKLIYNPFSGNNKIINQIDTIIGVYQKYGYQLIPFRISYEASLEDAFTDLNDEGWDHLLLAGGDGSVSDSINMMKKKKIDLPVGILPTGTANDFAKCLGIPSSLKEACEQIITSEVKKIDLGYVNGKFFINVLSFGLFTEVSQNTPTNQKNTMGKLAYYINGIKELPKFKKLKIFVEGKEYFYVGDAFLVFIFNGRTAGNINIAYKAKLDDGMLDVIIVKADLVHTTKSFLNFLIRNHLEDSDNGISYFRTNNVRIDCAEELRTDIDGEKGPEFPLHIVCKKHSLNILGYRKTEPKQIDKFLENLRSSLPRKIK
ncbi:YegS/Rv2252/BmrU family lipid kinase [Psychrilyobacter sp.]|uniref:YegS/Rv2252/BmrU family lipid kinase n=1 Tax=Psychrilyobacter sp. TaxID=2586924 RepID=UPI003019D48E